MHFVVEISSISVVVVVVSVIVDGVGAFIVVISVIFIIGVLRVVDDVDADDCADHGQHTGVVGFVIIIAVVAATVVIAAAIVLVFLVTPLAAGAIIVVDVDGGAGGKGTGAVFKRWISPPVPAPTLEKTSRFFGRLFGPPFSTWIIVDLAVFRPFFPQPRRFRFVRDSPRRGSGFFTSSSFLRPKFTFSKKCSSKGPNVRTTA